MLHELHERALAANQRKMDDFMLNKHERMAALKNHYVPLIKNGLIETADRGLMVLEMSLTTCIYNYNVCLLTGVDDCADQLKIFQGMIDEWVAEEPNWHIPILLDNPYTHTAVIDSIWFDFRNLPFEPNVFK